MKPLASVVSRFELRLVGVVVPNGPRFYQRDGGISRAASVGGGDPSLRLKTSSAQDAARMDRLASTESLATRAVRSPYWAGKHASYLATHPVLPVPDSLTYRVEPAPPSRRK